MQKSTLFIVLLAILVIFSVMDILVKKPFSQNLSADITSNVAPEDASIDSESNSASENLEEKSDSAEDFGEDSEDAQNFSNSSAASSNIDSPRNAPSLSSEMSAEIPDVSSFLQKRTFALQQITIDDLIKSGFQNMKFEQASFDQMLFQLLDLGTYPNLSTLRLHLSDGKNVFGILHEFEFEDSSKAALLYADLKQKIGAFAPNVTSNETNQYGDNSYYMNDKNRSGTAFPVFRIKNHLFGFSYPKASHEFFKSLIRVLENRLQTR